MPHGPRLTILPCTVTADPQVTEPTLAGWRSARSGTQPTLSASHRHTNHDRRRSGHGFGSVRPFEGSALGLADKATLLNASRGFRADTNWCCSSASRHPGRRWSSYRHRVRHDWTLPDESRGAGRVGLFLKITANADHDIRVRGPSSVPAGKAARRSLPGISDRRRRCGWLSCCGVAACDGAAFFSAPVGVHSPGPEPAGSLACDQLRHAVPA